MILTLAAIGLLVAAIVCGVNDSGPAVPLFVAGLICLAIRAAVLFGRDAPGPSGFDGIVPPGYDD